MNLFLQQSLNFLLRVSDDVEAPAPGVIDADPSINDEPAQPPATSAKPPVQDEESNQLLNQPSLDDDDNDEEQEVVPVTPSADNLVADEPQETVGDDSEDKVIPPSAVGELADQPPATKAVNPSPDTPEPIATEEPEEPKKEAPNSIKPTGTGNRDRN